MADEYLKAVAELEGDMREQIEEIGEEAVRTGKKAKKAFDKIDKEAREASRKIEDSVKKVGATSAKVFAVMGAATAAAGVAMSSAAADAEELESKFDALFAGSADDARAWGEEFRRAVGRGSIETRQALADMRGFTEGLKISGDEATELSFKLTQMAVDLSSFYNVEQEDASQRLRSGLIGNAEALDVFAARISESQLKEFGEEQGIVVKELSDTEKVLLRLELLQNKVNKAMGDAERTSGSFTNQMRALKGGLADASAEFGTLINEGISGAIESLGGPDKLIDLFEVGAAAAAEMSLTLVELARVGLSDAIEGMDELGGSQAVILQLRIQFERLRLGIRNFEEDLDSMVDRFDFLPQVRMFKKIEGAFESLASSQRQATDELIARREELSLAFDFERAMLEELEEQSPAWMAQKEAVAAAQAELIAYDKSVDPAIAKIAQLNAQLRGLKNFGEVETQASVDVQPFKADGFFGSLQESMGSMKLPDDAGEGLEIDSTEATEAIAKSLMVLKENAEVALGALGDVRDQIFSGGDGGEPEAESGWLSGVQEAADSSRVLFDRWAESMVDGSASAADAFDEFGKRFLKQAAAIILRQQLLNALGISFDGGFGFTGGGLSGALGLGAEKADGGILQGAAMANGGVLPFNAYASGGIATGPQLALMGENPFYKGEAFVPLPDGRKIEVEGGGMGGGVTFQVQAIDAASFRDKILEERETYIGLIREAAIRDRAFRQTLGQAR